MPLHIKLKNPLRLGFDLNGHLDSALKTAKRLGVDTSIYSDDMEPHHVVNSPEFIEAAMRKGYDGISAKESGRMTHAVFDPRHIKSAIGNRGTYDTRETDITKATGGSVSRLASGGQPSIPEMKLALSKQGMYSPLEKAAMAVPRTKGTPAEFMAEASKQPGYRKEEVEDRNISMPEQKMTKPEFVQHLKKHPMPLLDVAEMGEQAERNFHKEKRDLAEYLTHYDRTPEQAHDEAYDTLKDKLGYDPSETSYEQWQLPGGENYREVLLKTPHKGLSPKEREKLMWLEANKRRGDITPSLEKTLQILEAKKAAGESNYQSSHWQDHPNVLAHMRLSDRRGPNNEKLLHVEELQSDWHQAGRKHGYDNPEERQRIVEKLARNEELTPQEEKTRIRYLGRIGVQDAPHKKSWHELAMKHVLGEAARGGYHGIVITPGEEQAKRFDLSKHVDRVEYFPETNNLVAMKNGKMITAETVAPEKLDSFIGKEAAKRLLEQPVSPTKRIGETGMHLLEGQDLQVGGEGMKGFYDKILPDYLNKLGKPHGAKVGKMPLHDIPPLPREHEPEDAESHARMKATQLHHFPMTESMRKQILTEGLPQYKKGGGVHPLLPQFEE